MHMGLPHTSYVHHLRRSHFKTQVVTAVLAVAALAPIVAGMVKLPSHPFSCVVSNSDAAIDEVCDKRLIRLKSISHWFILLCMDTPA